MKLSPAQSFLAVNAIQRARAQRAAGREDVLIPFEELECLARAAAEPLGLDPDGFDLGAFRPLPDLTPAQQALIGAITEGGRTV